MRIAIILMSISLMSFGAAAQEQPPRPQQPGGAGRDDSQPLTAEQKAQVKDILAKYKADALTAADAKAINSSFRGAGLRNGPGLQEAIKDSGFAPEKIGQLDPPPGRAGGDQADAERPSTPAAASERPQRGPSAGSGRPLGRLRARRLLY